MDKVLGDLPLFAGGSFSPDDCCGGQSHLAIPREKIDATFSEAGVKSLPFAGLWSSFALPYLTGQPRLRVLSSETERPGEAVIECDF